MLEKHELRQLKDRAAQALAAGEHDRALATYRELERAEPQEADWSRRIADVQRKLGNKDEQVAALNRAAERHLRAGSLIKAIAVLKQILAVNPEHAPTRERIASLQSVKIVKGDRVAEEEPLALPDADPALEDPNLLYGGRVLQLAPERFVLPNLEGASASASASLEKAVPVIKGARVAPPPALTLTLDGAVEPAITELPLSEGAYQIELDLDADPDPVADRGAIPSAPASSEALSFEPDDDDGAANAAADAARETDRLLRAHLVLPDTPLFSQLDQDNLTRLIEVVRLVDLEAGARLFSQGDRADALYVVAEGRVEVVLRDASGAETQLAELGEGAFIGEVALVTHSPRTATVRALADTQLLAVDRSEVERLIREDSSMFPLLLRFVRDRMVDNLLRTHPLFTPLAAEDRPALAERFRFLDVQDQARLIDQGQPSEGLLLLLAGGAEVLRTAAEGEPPQRLAELRPGDLFGEMSLLSGEPAGASVLARGQSFVLFLPAADFERTLAQFPALRLHVDAVAQARSAIATTSLERPSTDEFRLEFL